MMKKHSLIEHVDDVREWMYAQIRGSFRADSVEDRVWWIAYERWLNDRELLSVEDAQE